MTIRFHPSFKLHRILFGAACILDGIIILFSAGFLYSTLALSVAKWHAKLEWERELERTT